MSEYGTMAGKQHCISLHYTVENVLQLLIAEGADLDSADNRGNTALMLAVEKSQYGVLKMLLGLGGSTDDATTGNGSTALHLATFKGDPKMVRLPLENETI